MMSSACYEIEHNHHTIIRTIRDVDPFKFNQLKHIRFAIKPAWTLIFDVHSCFYGLKTICCESRTLQTI